VVYISEEIVQQLIDGNEYVRTLAPTTVAMIALARLIVVAQYALAR
jgi:hypothetical protein